VLIYTRFIDRLDKAIDVSMDDFFDYKLLLYGLFLRIIVEMRGRFQPKVPAQKNRVAATRLARRSAKNPTAITGKFVSRCEQDLRR
jgi:hypothetical protein